MKKQSQVGFLNYPKFESVKEIRNHQRKMKSKTLDEVVKWETSRRAIFFKPLIEDLWKDYVKAEKRVLAAEKRFMEPSKSKGDTAKALKRLEKADKKKMVEIQRLSGLLHLSGGMDFFTYKAFKQAKKMSLSKMVNGQR